MRRSIDEDSWLVPIDYMTKKAKGADALLARFVQVIDCLR